MGSIASPIQALATAENGFEIEWHFDDEEEVADLWITQGQTDAPGCLWIAVSFSRAELARLADFLLAEPSTDRNETEISGNGPYETLYCFAAEDEEDPYVQLAFTYEGTVTVELIFEMNGLDLGRWLKQGLGRMRDMPADS